MVNNHTQINQRPLVQKITDPLLNQEEPPKIRDVNKVFMEKGVELALAAAKKALADWGGNLEDITHLGELVGLASHTLFALLTFSATASL